MRRRLLVDSRVALPHLAGTFTAQLTPNPCPSHSTMAAEAKYEVLVAPGGETGALKVLFSALASGVDAVPVTTVKAGASGNRVAAIVVYGRAVATAARVCVCDMGRGRPGLMLFACVVWTGHGRDGVPHLRPAPVLIGVTQARSRSARPWACAPAAACWLVPTPPAVSLRSARACWMRRTWRATSGSSGRSRLCSRSSPSWRLPQPLGPPRQRSRQLLSSWRRTWLLAVRS